MDSHVVEAMRPVVGHPGREGFSPDHPLRWQPPWTLGSDLSLRLPAPRASPAASYLKETFAVNGEVFAVNGKALQLMYMP